MEEWTSIVLRFAVYADLMALAGLAIGGGLFARAPVSPNLVRWLAGTGLALTLAQFAATATAMTGGLMPDFDMLGFLLFETPMGVSSLLRAAALAAIVILYNESAVRALGLVALGTLAWTGHAAASEGAIGWLHRGSDMIHLAAGAVWLGALLALAHALVFDQLDPASMRRLSAALRRFSRIGTIVVALLIVTGTVNLVAITGVDGLGALTTSNYGRVLGIKLALFAAMLGLAGLNRWRLAPAIGRAGGDAGAAVALLRRAVVMELALAFAVLAFVAVLGTLSPHESSTCDAMSISCSG